MTFLFTFFLPALAAASLPVLIHFLSRQRLPLIPFSSLEFLQRLQKRQARRVQLRQIILLILRTLAVLAVVAAFARPALKSRGGGGSGAATEMVVVLDDAFVSAAQTRDGSILSLESRAVNDLFDAAGPDDRITILKTSQVIPVASRGKGELEVVRADLKELNPSPVKPKLREAFAFGDSVLKNSARFNREIYLVGSFYGEEWDSIRWNLGKDVRLFLLPVGPLALSNASVEGVKLVSALRQKGKPVELEATLRNYGEQAANELPVSIYLEGERVAQGSVDLPAGGTVTKSFSITPAQSGTLAGSVRIEDPDPLSLDNRRFFILDVPEKVRLLAVVPDSLTRTILRAALGGEAGGFVETTFSEPSNWETQPLEGFDALLLADVPSVSAAAADRIREFAQSGGGLIVMPGPDTDPADLSRGVLAKLGFGGVRGNLGGGIGWGKFDISHPIFSGVFEEGGAPKSPSFQFALDFALSAGQQTIIPLTTGSPFLSERQIGRGRALLFAAPPSPISGGFIFSGIFAPLLYRSVAYVATGGVEGAQSVETGQIVQPVLPLAKAVQLTLLDPDGGESSLPPRPVMGGIEYDVGMIEHPGVWTFKDGETIVSRFAANPPTGLGRLSRKKPELLAEDLGGGHVLTSEGEGLAKEIASSRFGRELWRPIAAAFLGLLVAESVIGRARKEEA